LWARSARGELSGLTGVDAPYEAPARPELELSGEEAIEGAVGRVLTILGPHPAAV